MADEEAGQLPPGSRYFREGSRWVNKRPTPEEFAAWFKDNVKIHKDLDAEDYVGGIVLIPAESEVKRVTAFSQSGVPIIEKVDELVYIPYPKVETRVNYFWDLCAAEDWVGVIEPVELPRLTVEPVVETTEQRAEDQSVLMRERYIEASAMAQLVHQLPPGFSTLSIPVGERYTHFLCCTIHVAIYKKGDDGEPTGRPLREGRGTKMVGMLTGRTNPWADPHSIMKAETGALGRALGVAGVFVIPGSGVATAEDMQEAAGGADVAPASAAALPAVGQGPASPPPIVAPVRTGAEQAVETEEQLKAESVRLWQVLNAGDPDRAKEFTEWARGRNLTKLSDARGAALKGVVKKLQKLIDEGATQGVPDEQDGSSDKPPGVEGERPKAQPGGETTPEPSDTGAGTGAAIKVTDA